MKKLKLIKTELAEIDHQDNLVSSTKTWVKEIKEDIKNESRRIQTIRYD
jgi:hypothetical protein